MKTNYERVNDINKRKSWVLYISTFFTLIFTLNENFEITKVHPEFDVFYKTFVALNLVLIVGYLILDFRATYIYSRAERNRALQYLDNSFDTNFAGRKVENYFTQDKLAPGFYKLSVNCFENVFHTCSIAREMQSKAYFKAFIVILVFIFSAAVGDKGIVRSLIEAILPLALLQDAIKLSFFIIKLENLFDNFKSFFTGIKGSGFSNKEPEAMKYIIEYESTLAWASLPLDSHIFRKLRQPLAEEWEKLKQEYNIEN